MDNKLNFFSTEDNRSLWTKLIRNNLGIAIPIILSSVIVMGCSIDSAQIVSFKSEENWYFLGLFLPINYIMLGLLESGRLCSIRNASSKKSEFFELERTYLIAGIHIFFIFILMLLAASVFCLKLDAFYIKQENHLYFFQFSMAYMGSYLFISTNSIFNAALFGLGKNLTALFIIVGESFLFLLLTYVFYYYTTLGLYSLVVSTMIAYFIGSIIAWYMLRFALQSNAQKSNLIASWEVCKALVRNSGMPVFLSYLIMPISLLVFNNILSHFGKEVVASFGIAYRLQSLFMLPALAFGVASGILSNRLDDAEEELKKQYKLLAIWGAFLIGLPIMLILFIFSNAISMFLSNTPLVQKDIELYFYYIAWSYSSFFPLLALMTVWEQTGLAIKGLVLNTLIIVLQILSGIIALKYHNLILFYEALACISFFSAIIILGGSLLGRRKVECTTA